MHMVVAKPFLATLYGADYRYAVVLIRSYVTDLLEPKEASPSTKTHATHHAVALDSSQERRVHNLCNPGKIAHKKKSFVVMRAQETRFN